MTYATIDDLRSQLGGTAQSAPGPEYAAKMLHKIPDGTVVNREQFILEQCKGRRVLEFGASGPLHEGIASIASVYLGIDRESADRVIAFDLDDVSYATLPGSEDFNAGVVPNPDIIICGEVLEHLANPGWFLSRLHRDFPDVPVIISVPNAYTSIGRHNIAKGLENVNIDHVAWYSPRVLWTLLERYGYRIEAFHWYHGEPYFAEGFLVVAR